ncbi:MAG: prolyl oligopeptidase family serine peptidase [Gemmatimonadaceae bacterium]|nr:prolyl oligopeptidase family serine peptidase [Gemmatimonadaceae bacterium]
MPTRSLSVRAVRIAALLVFALAPVYAQQGNGTDAAKINALRETLSKEGYIEPSAEVAKLVTAPRHQVVALTNLSPDRKFFLREVTDGLPSVQTYGKPHVYFGGLQVDTKANRARALTARGAIGLQLIDARTGAATTIDAPKGATITAPTWSPDGKKIAFIGNFEAASYAFVVDVPTGKPMQLIKTPLLATLVTSVDWTADGKNIVAVLVPEPRAAMPQKPAIATGPQVRMWTDGTKAAERNYASLMEEPWEFDQFEYFITGQLAMIDVAKKSVQKVGAPAMISSVDASPDGKYFRLSITQKPFSYVVQYSAFGSVDVVWDATGKQLTQIAKRDLRYAGDTTGGGGFGGRGAPAGKKGLAWMPQGEGFYYIAQDSATRGDSARPAGAAPAAGAPAAGGRPGFGGAASRPEKVVQWLPPFGDKDLKVIYQHTGAIANAVFTDDAQTLFLATSNNGMGEIFAVKLSDPTKRMSIVRQRGWTPSFAGGGRAAGFAGGPRGGGDTLSFYTNPGSMLTKRGTNGGEVAVVTSTGEVFLKGTQYARDFLANPPRDFLDKVEMATGKKTRVFEGAAKDVAESLGSLLDDDGTLAVVTRESPTQVPNAFLKDFKAGSETQLTKNADPAPEFTAFQRKRIVVTRADGIKFVVNVTLPADYKAGTRLPGMFWFYPYEYTDQGGYDRSIRTENVNRFPTSGPRTIEFLAAQGYAVANFNPPIIGDAGRMNDNYVSDLRMNLYAVIDELDRQGFIDRTKLGLGGHSYGAFSTANAMVHTPFFKAGIAGDGMYNRTLTPNGFQSERRDLWNGQQTYLDMSPMLDADKLQGALLMYHSIEDQNVGTDPISSIRMMQALRANGKVASLFMYPYEDHGPVTKETLLDQWARWTTWLDLYVKHDGMSLARKKPATPAVQP